MPTTPPRYSAPDRSRQRVRLIAAVGLLASTAIAIGGVVGLLSADQDPAGVPTAAGSDLSEGVKPSSAPGLRSPLSALDSIDALILEVERAEQAASWARAALRRARIVGNIDAEQLDWLERRLDALGRPVDALGRPVDALGRPVDAGQPSAGHTSRPSDDRGPSQGVNSWAREGPREL